LAFIHPPMLAIIGVYFNKHRGLANSIFTSGGAIGGLAFGPVVVRLFQEYKYTGALLIVSGMLMNIFLAGLLMRPLELFQLENDRKLRRQKALDMTDHGDDELFDDDDSFRKRSLLEQYDDSALNGSNGLIADATIDLDKHSLTGSHMNLRQKDKHSKGSVIDIGGSIASYKGSRHHLNQSQHSLHGSSKHLNQIAPRQEYIRMKSYDPEVGRFVGYASPTLQRVGSHSSTARRRTFSEQEGMHGSQNIVGSRSTLSRVINALDHSKVALFTSCDGFSGSVLDINIVAVERAMSDDNSETGSTETDKKHCCLPFQTCLRDLLCTVFDLSLLKNPLFLLYLLMAFLMIAGVGLVPAYLPPQAKDVGLTDKQIGILVSILAAVDLVAKIGFGIIADRQWIRRPFILAGTAMLLGTCCHMVRFFDDFGSMVFLVAIAGEHFTSSLISLSMCTIQSSSEHKSKEFEAFI